MLKRESILSLQQLQQRFLTENNIESDQIMHESVPVNYFSESSNVKKNLMTNSVDSKLLTQSVLQKFQRPQLNIKKFTKISCFENDVQNNNSASTNQTDSASIDLKSSNSTPKTIKNMYFEKYEQLEKLGEGQHAIVYKVRNYQTNKLFAAKVIKCDNEEMRQIIEQEYKIMQMLQDPHIIKPEEFIFDEEKETIIIIQELFEGKSLSSFLNSKSRRKQFEQEEIINVIKQLLLTVQYLHENKIVHRDITILNVLYDEEQQIIKLIDFGISKEFIQNSEEFMISATCNKLFGAPEITKTENLFCNEKIDEFGCGLVLISLLEQQRIISSKIQKFIMDQKYHNNENNIYNLAMKLIDDNPEKRISAEEALQYLSKI